MSEGYDLNALLELRQQELESAEDDYAQQLQELDRQEDYLARKKADLEEAVERRKTVCAEHDERVERGEATLAQMNVFESYLSGLRQDELQLKDSIDRAERGVAEQKEAVARTKQKLIEATRELKAVEKHRAKWEQEQETKAQRKQAAAMDEAAARLWMEKSGE